MGKLKVYEIRHVSGHGNVLLQSEDGDYVGAGHKVYLVKDVAELQEQLAAERQRRVDLAADYAIAVYQRDELQEKLARMNDASQELAKELHAAIHEPMYAGTRKDWMRRAQGAEEKLSAAAVFLTSFAETIDYMRETYTAKSFTRRMAQMTDGMREEAERIRGGK